MSQPREEPRVVPAQLDFLTIYNPTLGTTDETLKKQIVYYHSRNSRRRHERSSKQKDEASETDDDNNIRLRQIGLAQGMVSFANNFSSTSNVDTIETEKSRIVLHELEKNWWILASVDLTRLPAARTLQGSPEKSRTEYSAREVAPAQLLIIQLVQANSLFLLHHATKLQELFSRVGRDTFCGLLERFWNKFARNWDVLLHGNPAAAVYNATKLAGGGELGIGVGEEEWGSGEREVLEGFIERTEGLSDLVVGRYGPPPETERANSGPDTGFDRDTWLGTGNDPSAADGVIFSGRGHISRCSLRTISQWMEAISKQGNDAYGTADNPTSRPRRKRNKPKFDRLTSDNRDSTIEVQELHSRLKSPGNRAPNLRKKALENNATPPGIPAPLVGQVERSLDQASAKATERASSQSPDTEKCQKDAMSSGKTEEGFSMFGTENMMKYLTLGYGKSWTINPKGLKNDPSANVQMSSNTTDTGSVAISTADDYQGLQEVDPTPEVSEEEKPFRQKLEQSIGKFLIGLSGDLEQTELDPDRDNDSDGADTTQRPEQRLFLRTLIVELAQPKNLKHNTIVRKESCESQQSSKSKSSSKDQPPTSAAASIDGQQQYIKHEKVQVAIYVHQPFIFVFLFELHTPNLTIPSFYRSIHNQLGPLQKPLLRSTDPSRVAERIAEATAGRPGSTFNATSASNPIYDLIFDPAKLIVRTSIPNIPVPGSLAAEGLTSNSSSSLSVSGAWYTLGIPVGNSVSPTANSGTVSSLDKLAETAWSRTEALNAHTQLLNTYLATRTGAGFEHTVKTSRGWWILWMKVRPAPSAAISSHKHSNTGAPISDKENPYAATRRVAPSPSTTSTVREHPPREAFLVRKAADFTPTVTAQSRTLSTGPGRWLLREQKRDVSGDSNISGAGVASAKGVSDGVGVDARKWVEGLVKLTS